MEALLNPRIFYIPERVVSALWALLLHGLIVVVAVTSMSQKMEPPKSLGGFEVVDLSSFGVSQPMPIIEEFVPPEPDEPIEEKVVEREIVEPDPEPEIKPIEKPEIKKVLKPIKLVIKHKVLHNIKPKSKPKPPPIVRAKKVEPVKRKVVEIRPVSVPVRQTKIVAANSGEAAYVAPNGTTAYLSNPKPAYPKMARRRGLEGVVVLAVSVSSQGSVKGLELKKSSGHKLLDNAAKNAVKRWRFTPATRGGIKVNAMVDVPIRFTLNKTQKRSS